MSKLFAIKKVGIIMASWLKLMKNPDSNYQHNLEFLKKYRVLGDAKALEWLVLNNANLVHKIVGNYRNFYNHNLAYDDLFSAGLEGLLRAVEKFDFTYTNNFATYAAYWIKQSVIRLITDEGFIMKVPSHLFESLHQIVCHEAVTDDKITKRQMCEKLQITNEKYDLICQVRDYMFKWCSLNKPVSTDDVTEIGELVSADDLTPNFTANFNLLPDEATYTNELQLAIEKGLKLLSPREQFIIIHRFGLYGTEIKTLAELGRTEGISRERIRQIEVSAISKLKSVMQGYEAYLCY